MTEQGAVTARPMEILVIDDSPDSLRFLTNLLKNRGYRVRSAASALSALRSIRKHLPDLILLKEELPDRDSLEFCRQLLSAPDTAVVPLMVVGAEDEVADKWRWFQVGCADYIAAPFEPAEILARVSTHLALKDLRENFEKGIQSHLDSLNHSILDLRREVAERTEGQQTLQNREGILRSILDSGLDGILVIDLKGKVLTSNPRFLEMWNIPAEMLTENCQDRQLVEYVLPQIENPERFQAKIGELYLTSARSSDIIELKDGRVFERFSSPLICKGEEAGRIWTFHDATERIQAEASLRESELKYRHLVDHIQDVMYKSDYEGNLTMVSSSFAQLLGYSSVEECLGKNIARTFYLHPEDREVFLEKLKRTGVVKDYEIMLRRKDGSAVPVATSSRLLLDAQGQPAGVEGIFRDVSDRKRAESLLKESESKLNAIIQQSPIPQFVIDHRHRVIYWNRALEECTGVRAEWVLGTRMHWKAFYESERPCLADLLLDGQADRISEWYPGIWSKSSLMEGSYSATGYFPQLGEEGRWLYFVAGVIQSPGGSVLGAVETLQDITPQRRAEEQLEEQNERLAILNRVARVTTGSLDPRMICDQLLEVIRSIMPCDALTVDRYYAEEKTIRGIATYDTIDGQVRNFELDEPELPVSPGARLLHEVIEKQAPLLIHRTDPEKESAVYTRFGDKSRPAASLLWAPMIVGNRVVGILSAQTYTRNAYRQRDVELLAAIASQAGPALEAALLSASLRESELHFRTLFEAAVDGIVLADLETGKLVMPNRRICEMLGYSATELCELTVDDIHPQDDLPYVKDQFERQIRSEVAVARDIPMRRKDGTLFFADVNSTRIDLGGRKYLMGMFRDITEKKKAEEALQASEAELRALFSAMSDVVIVIDSAGRYLKIAPTNPSLLYLPPEALLGKTLHETFPREQADFFHQAVLRTLQGEKPVTIEYCLPIRDRAEVWFAAILSPITEDSVVLVARDISERKRMENRLRQVNECLLNLGADFNENVNALTALCGKLLGGACALYSRLDSGLLHSLGQWNVPEGYHPLDRPEGHVCFDLIRKDPGNIALIRDLPETSCGETDSNGVRFGFRTYIGHVVLCSGKRVGVLSVLFKTDVELTDDDRRLLGIVASALGSEEDRRQAEEQRQSQIRFLESLETIERALRGTADLDRMLETVIDSVRTVFDCDRAWLFYPCVPEAKTFAVPLIASRPEYAIGPDELRAQPISSESSQVIQAALDSDEPLRFDPEAGRALPDSATRFGVQSQLLMAIHPRAGMPWIFGMHQCSRPRVWTENERRLFQEIGRRIADALSGLLFLRDLQEREARLEGIFRASPAGIGWVCNRILKHVNDRVCEMTGRSREELLEQSTRILYPDDAEFDRVGRDIYGEIAARGIGEGETRWIRKDGSILDILLTSTPLDATDISKGLILFALDITGRKRAEEEARQAIQRLAFHFDQTPLGVIEWDLDFRVTSWNSAAEKIFGFQREEALGRHAFDLIVPKHAQAHVEQVWSAMMAGTGGGKSINENVTKDGQLRICEWYNTALMDSEGQRVGAASVVQDITERQRAEEAERHSRMVTEAITDASIHFLETASVGAMAQLVVEHAVRITGAKLGLVVEMVPSDRGPQPRILAVSEMAWSTMKGHSLYSEAKKSISEKGFYPLAFSEALVFSPMIEGATVLANHPFSHPLWQGRMPSGHPVIESFLGVPMKIGDEILGMIALANRPQGFGEREVRELETFATTGALALRMGRTEEDRRRMEEQLRQSQKMEAIGQLAGGVAHDFNNLLMAILGNAEFAMDGLAPQDPRRGNLEGIQAAGERAATLTRQLLAFSRRQVLRPEDLDLNAVVGELIKMLGRLIGENIHLEILPASDLGLIRADRAQIEQVLMNLVVNARDAMPEGGKITIETATADLDEDYCRVNPWVVPGRFVKLTVTDTGIGMDEQVLSHIFEPFFTTKEQGKGTGLGLAMVYGIVRQHGGIIQVQSEPGQGSAFQVFIPGVQSREVSAPEAVPPPPPGGVETILMAEDDSLVRNLMIQRLEGAGYTVLAAPNGEEALRLFEAHRGAIDLVLLDMVMPGMSGRAVRDRIRDRHPDMRFLFMTGYSTEARPGFVLDSDMTLLSKPFDAGTLLRKVREVLDA